jgi:hypothetical protein
MDYYKKGSKNGLFWERQCKNKRKNKKQRLEKLIKKIVKTLENDKTE